jgi:hypothetical protein
MLLDEMICPDNIYVHLICIGIDNMLLNIDNPVYNTIIIFSIIMLIIYISKPDILYDNKKNEFRQFGTTNGKTLLPIYVIGILLAIVLYVFFYYLSGKNKTDKVELHNKPEYVNGTKLNKINNDISHSDQINIQQQIHNLQTQMSQLIQNQINTLNVQSAIQNTNLGKTGVILPNVFNV